MKHIYHMLMLSLAVVLVLAACGNDSNTASHKKDGDTVSIKHALGTTDVPKNPKRVVTLYQGATDVAVALGVEPVGAVESWKQQPKYDYLKDKLKHTTIVGQETAPNLEEISKLKPDLIIASKVRNEKVYDQLSKIAPTVSHETVYKFKETTELMGKALGKEKEAEALLKQYNDKVNAFKKDAKAKYGDQWPISASVVNFRADQTRVYAGGYAGDILQDLGFKRPDAQQKEVDKGKDIIELASKESIPLINADQIFIFKSDPHAADAKLVSKTEKDWTSSREWQNLDAVKKGHVANNVDEITWNLAGGYHSALDLIDNLYKVLDIQKVTK